VKLSVLANQSSQRQQNGIQDSFDFQVSVSSPQRAIKLSALHGDVNYRIDQGA